MLLRRVWKSGRLMESGEGEGQDTLIVGQAPTYQLRRLSKQVDCHVVKEGNLHGYC